MYWDVSGVFWHVFSLMCTPPADGVAHLEREKEQKFYIVKEALS